MQRFLYRHRQVGWALFGLALVPPTALLAAWWLHGGTARDQPVELMAGLGLASMLALLGSMSLTVTVTAVDVTAVFGLGLFRRAIVLDAIRGVTVGTSRWYEGWGMHWTRDGWLYNVAGFDTVRLELDDGKSFRIGSDEAERLRQAIVQAVDERRAMR